MHFRRLSLTSAEFVEVVLNFGERFSTSAGCPESLEREAERRGRGSPPRPRPWHVGPAETKTTGRRSDRLIRWLFSRLQVGATQSR